MRIKDDAPSPQPEKVLYDNRIKRKNVLALNDKVAAIREYERMPVYKRIGRMFNCSPDQIKRIVQQKETILKAWEQRTRRCQDAKTLELKVVRVSMLGKAVYEWIRRMMYYKDITISDGLIQKMALQFKSAMGLLNFFPHQEWCDKFRSTYKITAMDSKLLDIGYTQGYSVQIKDIIKDVLSECKPEDENGNSDEDDDAADDDVDDEDFDDDDDGGGGDGDGANGDDNGSDGEDVKTDLRHLTSKAYRDNGHGNGNEQPPAAKKMRTISLKQQNSANLKLVAAKNVQNNNNNNNNNNNSNKNMASTSQKQQQQQQQQKQRQQRQLTTIPMPKLQPIRQLVALPIQTGSVVGMTQKVLVATPITPNNMQRNGGNVCGINNNNNNNTPMTMTIIPFATLAQAASSATQQQQLQAKNSTTTTRKSAAAAAATTTAVPPPLLDIKTEIKKEPLDEVPALYIKQEYISDEEAESEQQQPTLTALAKPKPPPPIAELPEGAAVKVNFRRKSPAGDDDAVDDDNLILSNLRHRINKPVEKAAAAAATAATSDSQNAGGGGGGGGGSTTRSARSKQMKLKTTKSATAATTPPPPPLAAAAAVAATSTASPTTATNSQQRLSSSKAKRNCNETSGLAPIKSCLEARRYLKLLEDFALYKENFRLIGLITRADEVLRELDGDDDVDID